MDPTPSGSLLEQRLGRALLTQRRHLQEHYVSRMFGHGLTYFHIENMLWVHWMIRFGLKMTGLYNRGRRNALSVRVKHNRLPIRGLPPEFEGFVLLQLSDLHLDINEDMADAIARVVAPLQYDMCVMTGDYRAKTYGSIDRALEDLARLRRVLHGEVYGVMGNHDFVEMLPRMEAMGIRFLMNEHILLRRGGAAICLAGVDDIHFYETDNIQKAAAHLDHEVPSILLSHSPEIYRKAAACKFDAVLCGHTHGGQICLPGGFPLLVNTRAPLKMARGAWEYRGMKGYTSVGTGCSGIDVRFCCPPEVTLHTLVSTPDPCAA
ncbi:MAG: metallophosphoesterase [bacterium]